MNTKTFNAMTDALRISLRHYPHCRVASCDCHSKNQNEWLRHCYCPCHFTDMDETYGEDNWNLTDFGNEADKERS